MRTLLPCQYSYPAENETSSNFSGFDFIISIVWTPMEPVAPNKLIFFLIIVTLSVMLRIEENGAAVKQKGDCQICPEFLHAPEEDFPNP